MPSYTCIDVNSNFRHENLIPLLIEQFFGFSYIDSNNVNQASIVLKGVHPVAISRRKKLVNRLKRFAGSATSQIFIHVSGEAPSFKKDTSFIDSRCHYGIGYEAFLPQNLYKNYFFLPIWMGSLDWSSYGINQSRSSSIKRIGFPILPNRLCQPLSWENWAMRENQCASMTSHYPPIRHYAKMLISSAMHIEGYGPFYNPDQPNHNSGIPKDKCFPFYRYSLSVENTLYPGYCTEKIPESHALGCLPITFNPGVNQCQFEKGSYIDLKEVCDSIDSHFSYSPSLSSRIREYFLSINKSSSFFHVPLLQSQPTLDSLIEFLRHIASQV